MNRIGQRPACSPPHRVRGFTVLELMITIVVVAILAALAAPAMSEFIIRANVSTTTNNLVTALNLARAEAVKRGRDVAVIANGGDWSTGWTVQVVNVAGNLTQYDALPADYLIRAQSTGGGTPDQVTFGATGAIRAATAFDLNVCRPTTSPGAADSRWVNVRATGTIRSRRNTVGSPAGSCA